MTAELPPFSIKAMHYSKPNVELERKQSLSYPDIEGLKNKFKDYDSNHNSMTFKTEEEKNSKNNTATNEINIAPFHLSSDPQFKSTLPYLMIESFFLVIAMNINETVKNKNHYQFAVLSSVVLLAHHIIMDTSITYLSKWGKLTTGYLTLLMVYSALTILSTLTIWIIGDYKADWIIPKTVIFFWCLFTYYTWQCMFIRLYEYRLTIINRRFNNEYTIWRSKNDKQKYYQKSL